MPRIEDVAGRLDAATAGPVSTVVARHGEGGVLEARKLNLAQSAAEGFRTLCRDAVDGLREARVVAYTADAELEAGEIFVLDDAASLDELADLRRLGTAAATLPVIRPKDLDLTIQLYAVAVGTDRRAVFVRRTDPQIRHRAGGFLAIAEEQLRQLDEPTFSFSPGFDLVLCDDVVVVLNQTAFERLFRDIGLVERHVEAWVHAISDHLPMDEASVDALREVALRDSRTWRRLREISRRGHLASVRLADVRRYARRVGLDPDRVVEGDRLVFDARERFSFLHLLNEDLYRGPLTDETFEAQRKTPAGT